MKRNRQGRVRLYSASYGQKARSDNPSPRPINALIFEGWSGAKATNRQIRAPIVSVKAKIKLANVIKPPVYARPYIDE